MRVEGRGRFEGMRDGTVRYLILGCSKADPKTRIPEHVVYLEGDSGMHR